MVGGCVRRQRKCHTAHKVSARMMRSMGIALRAPMAAASAVRARIRAGDLGSGAFLQASASAPPFKLLPNQSANAVIGLYVLMFRVDPCRIKLSLLSYVSEREPARGSVRSVRFV